MTMQYRQLGRSGLSVSEIGLGGWAIGGVAFDDEGRPRGYGHQEESISIATLERAVSLGVNFFDTGAYGAHKGELYTGKALRPYRDKVIIQTKGGTYYEGNHRVRDFSPKGLRWQLEQSLMRLQTDYVDCYVLHEPSESQLEEGFPTLLKFKEEGKARLIGVSPFPSIKSAELYFKTNKVDVATVSFNILNPGMGLQIFGLAKQYNVGVICMQPLAAGFLTGTITEDTVFGPDDWRSTWPRERVQEMIRRVRVLSSLVGGDMRQLPVLALRYVLSFPEVSSVIVGARTPGEIEQNVTASNGEALPAETLNRIRRLQENGFRE